MSNSLIWHFKHAINGDVELCCRKPVSTIHYVICRVVGLLGIFSRSRINDVVLHDNIERFMYKKRKFACLN